MSQENLRMNTSQKLMALRRENKKLKVDYRKLNASMTDASRVTDVSVLADYRRILDAIDEPQPLAQSSKLRERRSESKKKQLRNHLEWKPKLDSSAKLDSLEDFQLEPHHPIPSIEGESKSSPSKQSAKKEEISSSNMWEGETEIRKSLVELKMKDAKKKHIVASPEPSPLKEHPGPIASHFDSNVKFKNGQWEINTPSSKKASPRKSHGTQPLQVESFNSGSQKQLLNTLVKNSGLLQVRDFKDKENLFSKHGSISERIQCVQKSSKPNTKENLKKSTLAAPKSPLTISNAKVTAAENSAKLELYSKLERFGRQIEKLKANFDVISPFLMSSHVEGSLQFEKEIKHELQAIEKRIKNFAAKRF